MIGISVVSECGGRRIRLLDESTGASEEVFLNGSGVPAGNASEPVEITVADGDELSGRHQYCP